MLFVKSKGRNTLNIGLTFMNLFSFFLILLFFSEYKSLFLRKKQTLNYSYYIFPYTAASV